jgi:hypothetical protein
MFKRISNNLVGSEADNAERMRRMRLKTQEKDKQIISAVLERLENGAVPWRKTWEAVPRVGECLNAVTAARYNGHNVGRQLCMSLNAEAPTEPDTDGDKKPTRKKSPTMITFKTDEKLWEAFGEYAKAINTDRSKLLNAYIKNYVDND